MMRHSVPGMCGKTDKATVFEYAAQYIEYLKQIVGRSHDEVVVFLC